MLRWNQHKDLAQPLGGDLAAPFCLQPALFGNDNLARPRVLLADDNPEFRGIVAHLLQTEFDVVSTIGDGQAVINEATRLDPDVLVLDISMPMIDGIAAARQLRETGSVGKVVFLTVHEDTDYVQAALTAGASGYVLKSRVVSDLLPALNEALSGRQFISPVLER
jgi:DNA-binding NarL/FixJ family response regulator